MAIRISVDQEIIGLDPQTIDYTDQESIKAIISKLLNVIESLLQLIEDQQKEIQSLKDEINRLKGEKGKPDFSPNVPRKEEKTQSPGSGTKQEEKKKWKKGRKSRRLK